MRQLRAHGFSLHVRAASTSAKRCTWSERRSGRESVVMRINDASTRRISSALGGYGSGSRWCDAATQSRQRAFSRRRYAEAIALLIRHVAFSRPCREPVHRRHADSTRRRCTTSTGPPAGTQLTAKVSLSLVLATAVCHLDSADVKTLLKPGPSDRPSCRPSKARHGTQSTAASSGEAGCHEHQTEAHKFATPRLLWRAFGMRMHASTTSAKPRQQGDCLRSKASSPSAAQLPRHAVPSRIWK